MVVYNFKQIQVVPTAQDFIDIVLSKTQRKTPTVIHKHLPITRIRQFYMRKVKFTQQTYHDRVTQILEDFPVLDDIHPFYSDLINVLYDRDHYKLALGQLNIARHLIDNLAKDYLRLLKFGDSLYRCKQLKRAALGRMCTLMKKQGPNLSYLEHVRQHLARLPAIDPNTRSIILCGYPNVGKSSFMNKVTRADVDVQPYAFTTKSLFVGHSDYKYLRWQILDTPGILDHPLEERNTIEMLSITALAHLRAAIVFVIDISEQCGYSIEEQIKLFESIKPLFINKPLVVALNKIDVVTLEKLREDAKALLQKLEQDERVHMIPMSTLTEEGVNNVKEFACQKLLDQRLDMKLNTLRQDDVLRRLHVAIPQARDSKARPAQIPSSVFQKKDKKSSKKLKEKEKMDDDEEDEDEMEEEEEEEEEKEDEVNSKAVDLRHINRWAQGAADPEHWDPTVFGPDWRHQYDLENEEWKFDNIPEIINGMNVADWIDADILMRLKQTEREEEQRLEAAENDMEEEEPFSLTEEDLKALRELREEESLSRLSHRMKKGKNRSVLPSKDRAARTDVNKFEEHLKTLGIEPSSAVERARSRSRSRSAVQERGRKRARSQSRERDVKAKSKSPHQEGLKDKRQKLMATSIERKSQKKANKEARKGEGDRVILNMKPKHLFAGKRGMGKTDRR